MPSDFNPSIWLLSSGSAPTNRLGVTRPQSIVGETIIGTPGAGGREPAQAPPA